MDKRHLARLFRDRLQELVARNGSTGRFVRQSGIDRSALSQFLDPELDRLPRAETLRKIAETAGVSSDWLLGLSNTDDPGKEFAPSVEIEMDMDATGASPLDRWRQEARGQKVRYVPATLPDLLRLPEAMDYELEGERASARMEQGEQLLGAALLGDMDMEVAMPFQTLEDFAAGTGIWRGLDQLTRQRQLDHMAEVVEESYPMLRLHLYDAQRTFSAPFTVFGVVRAVVYLGGAYLVVTSVEQVRALARLFDGLVRDATVLSSRAHEWIRELKAA